MHLGSVETATLLRWQAEALDAFHALQTGRREASMSVGAGGVSRAVSYTAADLDKLRAWLTELAAELGRRTGVPVVRRRAIGVRF